MDIILVGLTIILIVIVAIGISLGTRAYINQVWENKIISKYTRVMSNEALMRSEKLTVQTFVDEILKD